MRVHSPPSKDGAVSGRKMKEIGKSSAAEKTLTPELRKNLTSGSFLFSIRLRPVIFLGIILIMVARPEIGASFLILVASIVIGSLPMGRRTHESAMAQADAK